MGSNGDRRIGIVSTRLAGTDGVSLETAKWAAVLERLGYSCFWLAGELDRPAEVADSCRKRSTATPTSTRSTRPSIGRGAATAAADSEHPRSGGGTSSPRTCGRTP